MEKVDVDKLERELVNALQADKRYSRENDAKFRAVNQRVQTYEEFRCIHTHIDSAASIYMYVHVAWIDV